MICGLLKFHEAVTQTVKRAVAAVTSTHVSIKAVSSVGRIFPRAAHVTCQTFQPPHSQSRKWGLASSGRTFDLGKDINALQYVQTGRA